MLLIVCLTILLLIAKDSQVSLAVLHLCESISLRSHQSLECISDVMQPCYNSCRPAVQRWGWLPSSAVHQLIPPAISHTHRCVAVEACVILFAFLTDMPCCSLSSLSTGKGPLNPRFGLQSYFSQPKCNLCCVSVIWRLRQPECRAALCCCRSVTLILFSQHADGGRRWKDVLE